MQHPVLTNTLLLTWIRSNFMLKHHRDHTLRYDGMEDETISPQLYVKNYETGRTRHVVGLHRR